MSGALHLSPKACRVLAATAQPATLSLARSVLLCGHWLGLGVVAHPLRDRNDVKPPSR